MEHNICNECGTENEKEYIYCKNCGASLASANAPEPAPQPAPQQPEPQPHFYRAPETQSYQDTYHPPYEAPAAEQYARYHTPANNVPPMHSSAESVPAIDTIDGIPIDEVGMFIGKKSDSILPKFQRMAVSGSKVSWCWPVAVLSFLFGPLGAAIWFFYRKMNKIAWILVGIGSATAVLSGCLTAIFNHTEIAGQLNIMWEALLQNLPEMYSEFTPTYALGTLISQPVSIACTVITGLFAHHWYKNHCVSRIIAYRQSVADMRYYQFGLLSIGGVSGGLLVLGIALLYVMQTVESVISAL